MDVSAYAVIGNYSELNPKDCGITRLTNFENMCFEWYKNPIPRLIQGRDATEGDVPWMAHVLHRPPNSSQNE